MALKQNVGTFTRAISITNAGKNKHTRALHRVGSGNYAPLNPFLPQLAGAAAP